MTLAPKRRWFRFSLRTLFVVMTAFGCWLGYELDWIRQRHAMLARHQAHFSEIGVEAADLAQAPGTSVPRAPAVLWLFGEQGRVEVDLLFIVDKDEERGKPLDSFPDVRLAKRLFPEAKVEALVLSRRDLDPFPVLSRIIAGIYGAVEPIVRKPTTAKHTRNDGPKN